MKNRIALTLLAVVALPALVSCGAASVADAPTAAFAPTTSNVESNALFSKAIQLYGDTFFAKYDADKDGKLTVGKQVLTKMGLDLAALKENVQQKKESIALLATKSLFGGKGISCHELQPLLAGADADKDGAVTMDELKAFIKKSFDRNNNDQLGLFERIRFRFSALKERSKKLTSEQAKVIPPAQAERLPLADTVPSVEAVEDADKPALPTAQEQEALNS